ncbi:MAG TPA: hypothetical protein P5556_06560 [Candidatus Gastranaerophilales bacterium]|nr:hypothetical protein [Candidatus Gastranaerophilales bacterium]
MNKLLENFKNIFKINCNHFSARAKDCKFCPDCGKKIVSRWILIKCQACGHYRKPVIDSFGKIKPLKKYCFYCGYTRWKPENYYEPTIPDSLKSIAIKKIETEKKQNLNFGNLTKKSKIWIDISK